MAKKQHFNYVPDPCEDIQVNCCKNPTCPNFGVPHLTKDEQTQKRNSSKDARYKNVGSGSKKKIRCNSCKENIPIKSNKAVFEEFSRFKTYLHAPLDNACQNSSCENSLCDVRFYLLKYRKFGSTSNGKQRYQCKICKKTLSITPKASRQKYSHKNKTIFKLLMNYVPFRRILEIEDVHFQTLYDKIDFIENRCLKYMQFKENSFFSSNRLERLYLGCDQQFFTLNWTSTYEKRNIILRSIATCDNDNRYCFGMHLNYDFNVDAGEIDRHSEEIQDDILPPAYRTYARVWLKSDYWEALKKSYHKSTSKHKKLIEFQVHAKYLDALTRDDIEVPPDAHENSQLPHRGVQVHSEYTLYGHFFFLQNIFKNVEKLRFFIDQDSGMRAACISAFFDRIRDRTCDVFYISTDNDVSIHERKKINQRSAELIKETMTQNGFDYENQARRFLLAEAIENSTPIGKWQDRWVKFPYSHAGELNKMACHLTSCNDYDIDHLVNLFLKASIHATDSFFQLTRRRLRLVERPLKTSGGTNQWNGYSAYNPQKTQQLLNIFRAYYNFCMVGQDGKTPAMRIGMSKSKVNVEDILYFGSY